MGKLNKPTDSRGFRSILIIFHILTLVMIAFAYLQFFGYKIKVDSFLMWFYLSMLTLYTGHKETLRWKANIFSDRMGEIYVYLIVGSVVLTGILASIFPGKFTVPNLLKQIAIPVISLFIGTETSKTIFLKKFKQKTGD
ncbi:hypothetical protein J7K86_02240 [bacterium]|nr:hypothetical protein [bacterium]